MPESPDLATVLGHRDASITDAFGNTYAINFLGQVTFDGISEGIVAKKLVYSSRTIWYQDIAGHWHGRRRGGDPWGPPTVYSPLVLDRIEALEHHLCDLTVLVQELLDTNRATKIVLDVSKRVTELQPVPTEPGP